MQNEKKISASPGELFVATSKGVTFAVSYTQDGMVVKIQNKNNWIDKSQVMMFISKDSAGNFYKVFHNNTYKYINHMFFEECKKLN